MATQSRLNQQELKGVNPMNTSLDKTDSILEESRSQAPEPLGKTLRTMFGKLVEITSDLVYIDAMQNAVRDVTTFRKAMEDPRGYFERQGVSLPPDIVVTMEERRTKAEGFKLRLFGLFTLTFEKRCYSQGCATVCGEVHGEIEFDYESE
jgi:hypothetical protein